MSTEVKLNSLHYPLKIEDENLEKEMLKPFWYLLSNPSTKFRRAFLNVLKQWIPVPEDKFVIVDEFGHYVFNAAFLLDDIQDRSILRRGTPSAHMVYGIPRALIAFNCIFSMSFGYLHDLNNMKLAQEFVKNCATTFAGQGMEIYWRDNNICPTEEEFVQMVYRKASLPLLIMAKTMYACSSGTKVDCEKLLKVLGLYIQLCDDYNNLSNQDYFGNKGFCEDLSEGKFGFPVVHAVNNFPEEGQIIKDIMAQRTQDIKEKQRCLSLLEKCGSLEYTRNKIKELKGLVCEEINKLDPNPLLVELLEHAVPRAVNYH